MWIPRIPIPPRNRSRPTNCTRRASSSRKKRKKRAKRPATSSSRSNRRKPTRSTRLASSRSTKPTTTRHSVLTEPDTLGCWKTAVQRVRMLAACGVEYGGRRGRYAQKEVELADLGGVPDRAGGDSGLCRDSRVASRDAERAVGDLADVCACRLAVVDGSAPGVCESPGVPRKNCGHGVGRAGAGDRGIVRVRDAISLAGTAGVGWSATGLPERAGLYAPRCQREEGGAWA